ncbi:MAG: hypothetical protein H0W14_08125 [Actinobacteria bacterium]|nr:hypothetical protein [Actinomycetota bacterium]
MGGLTEGGFAHAKGMLEVLYGALKVELSVAPGARSFLYPGRAAELDAGWLGELHPDLLEGRWGVFELDLDRLLAGSRDPVQYADVITFPPVKQDLAFVVDLAVPAAALFAAAREAAGPELHEVRFLSDFREPPIPAGRKSLAFRVEFRSPARTLTDEDVAPLRERIVTALAERFGAELRA